MWFMGVRMLASENDGIGMESGADVGGALRERGGEEEDGRMGNSVGGE